MTTKRPIYWLAGNSYECDLALDQILEKHGRDNVVILDGSSDPVDRVFANLIKSDFFSKENKVIRLRGLPPDYQLILEYFKYVNKNRVLIIESPFQVRMGKKKVDVKKTNFFKEIKKIGKVFDFPIKVSSAKARNWVVKACEKAYKKNINSDAASLLVELKNCNLNHIFAELNKLSAYIGRKKKITVDDVKVCVIDDKDFNIWKMVDHLTEEDFKSSIKEIEDLWVQKDYATQLELFMGALIFRFELLLFSRVIGTTDGQSLINELSFFRKKAKKKPEPIRKYNEKALMVFSYSKIVKEANIGTKRLVQILEVIYFTHISLRALSSTPSLGRNLISNMIQFICRRLSADDFFDRYDAKGKMMIATR